MTPTIGSHTLLLQLATNLVQNAIVHNLRERGTVSITTSVQPKSALLTVENTGDKLTPDWLPRSPSRFFAAPNAYRTDHAGVGLGLAIVKSIDPSARRNPHPHPPRTKAGSASRCNYPPRHRRPADDDQGDSRPVRP